MSAINSSEFKPSKKLLNMWICLPQNSISIRHNQVEPLFGTPKNFGMHYLLFCVLIGLEIFTVFTLSHRGVDYKLLLVFIISELIIACIPQIIEWTRIQWCSSFIKAKLFIHKTKLRLLDPSLIQEAKEQENTIAEFQRKLLRINLVKFFMAVVIIAFGVLKFAVYYDLYHMKIFVNPAGRLILLSCVLGIITHLLSTRIVLLNTYFWFRKRKEGKKKEDGYSDYQNREGYRNYPIELNLFESNITLARASENGQLLREELEVPNQGAEELEVNERKKIYSGTDEIRTNAYMIIKDLFLDSQLNGLIMSQKNDVSREIVAISGKEIQLLQLT